MSSTNGRLYPLPQATTSRGRDSRPSKPVLPEGLLTVILVVVMALGMGAAVISRFTDNNAFQVLSQIGEQITSHDRETETGRPFGACADICTTDGACRFVVIAPGLRPRQAASLERLNAAQSCH